MKNVPKFVSLTTVGAKDLKDRPLSDEDRENISTFRKKQDLLCDQVRLTALGYSNGLYVYGSPGTGKTFSVTSVLRHMGNNPVLCNSELSARGLFETFRDNPDGVILIDDVHSCVTDQKSRQVMLAGFGGDIGKPREVTYTTANGREVARFRGSGIVISNLRLRNDPTSKAITSRMGSFSYDPASGELLSMMKLSCLQGKDGLKAPHCFEVLTFIEQSGKSFDLRVINKGLSLRRYARDHGTCQNWQTMLLSAMDEQVEDNPVMADTRQETKGHELNIASEILERFPSRKQRTEREQEWHRLTGKSADSLYRRMRELKAKKRAA